MSVRLNKEGRVVITCKEGYYPHEAHYLRISALIELIQQRHEDFTNSEPVFHALDLLEDMLPEEAQWKELLHRK